MKVRIHYTTNYMRPIELLRLIRNRLSPLQSAIDPIYRAMFEDNPHTMWVYDSQTLAFLAVNDAALQHYGYSKDEFLSMTILDLSPAQEVEAVLKQQREGKPFSSERTWKHRKKDGSLIDVEILGHIFRYEGRESVLVAVHDVTERKRTEEQRLALTREETRINVLTDFITSFSHDFRTPLSTIKTGLYLLRKDGTASEQRLKRLDEQVETLETLIESFVVMARLDSEPRLTLSRLDINTLLSRIYGKFQGRLEAKGLRHRFSPSPEPIRLVANEVELQRAIENLMENALVYTPAGGEVELCAGLREQWAAVEVRDSGVGIEAEDLPYIFDRFYRADKARSQAGRPGLGLSIARKIIELHQGHIVVESKPEQGSTFRVLLPLQPIAA
ncbi:MAG: PAS domain S-box protein [Anaerolineae bacterium]|nr:PAS domain S-box protein [Anaerolineae bacterium]